ncbi:MAG: hypothetical protein CR997_11220 [Acidobacteria bacterium]|nr:MAG: hypothetical protein CR997_11220 [Acidobacteriota bacterium]
MATKVTALNWRPQTFSDLVGQGVISTTLQNAIRHDRLHHAYLFAGLRGSGKTSTARIFAKALNCEKGPTPEPCLKCASCKEIRDGNSMDVIEIDAASNNSVDNIRELREMVRYNAARDKNKIYIIDEVHMLSTSAFNALLKTLEEPPPNVFFIMATTELHKIPATILSRSQQFDFKQIPASEIEKRVEEIVKVEKINITKEAIGLIATAAKGSMRDALSLFDQVVAASGEEITVLEVEPILGLVKDIHLVNLMEGVVTDSVERVLTTISELINSGHDLKGVYDSFTSFVRDLIVLKSVTHTSEILVRQYGDPSQFKDILDQVTHADLVRYLNVLVSGEQVFRQASVPQYGLELVLFKMLELKKLQPLETLISDLQSLSFPDQKKNG